MNPRIQRILDLMNSAGPDESADTLFPKLTSQGFTENEIIEAANVFGKSHAPPETAAGQAEQDNRFQAEQERANKAEQERAAALDRVQTGRAFDAFDLPRGDFEKRWGSDAAQELLDRESTDAPRSARSLDSYIPTRGGDTPTLEYAASVGDQRAKDVLRAKSTDRDVTSTVMSSLLGMVPISIANPVARGIVGGGVSSTLGAEAGELVGGDPYSAEGKRQSARRILGQTLLGTLLGAGFGGMEALGARQVRRLRDPMVNGDTAELLNAAEHPDAGYQTSVMHGVTPTKRSPVWDWIDSIGATPEQIAKREPASPSELVQPGDIGVQKEVNNIAEPAVARLTGEEGAFARNKNMVQGMTDAAIAQEGKKRVPFDEFGKKLEELAASLQNKDPRFARAGIPEAPTQKILGYIKALRGEEAVPISADAIDAVRNAKSLDDVASMLSGSRTVAPGATKTVSEATAPDLASSTIRETGPTGIDRTIADAEVPVTDSMIAGSESSAAPQYRLREGWRSYNADEAEKLVQFMDAAAGVEKAQTGKDGVLAYVAKLAREQRDKAFPALAGAKKRAKDVVVKDKALGDVLGIEPGDFSAGERPGQIDTTRNKLTDALAPGAQNSKAKAALDAFFAENPDLAILAPRARGAIAADKLKRGAGSLVERIRLNGVNPANALSAAASVKGSGFSVRMDPIMRAMAGSPDGVNALRAAVRAGGADGLYELLSGLAQSKPEE